MRLAKAVLVPALSTYSAMLVSIAEASLPTNSSVGLIGFGRSRRAVHHWAEQAELPIEPIMPPFDGLGRASYFGIAQDLELTAEAVIARGRYWLHVTARSANALC